nr:transcriptional regulatory protein AlgP-like [Aegilops tauschii subsp. strangulata]
MHTPCRRALLPTPAYGAALLCLPDLRPAHTQRPSWPAPPACCCSAAAAASPLARPASRLCPRCAATPTCSPVRSRPTFLPARARPQRPSCPPALAYAATSPPAAAHPRAHCSLAACFSLPLRPAKPAATPSVVASSPAAPATRPASPLTGVVAAGALLRRVVVSAR